MSNALYARWREEAIDIFASYNVPLRRRYTVRQMIQSRDLRNAIRDTYYLLYRWMRNNARDRMDELALTDDEAILLAADFIAQFRQMVLDLWNAGLGDEVISVDPADSVLLEPDRITNLTEFLAGEATELEFEEGYEPY